MVDLPSAEHVAFVAVAVLAAIVAWDAYWLTKQRRDVPEMGSLPGGGFAWKSEGVHEMVRQWGNLGSMAAMMVLPWALMWVIALAAQNVLVRCGSQALPVAH